MLEPDDEHRMVRNVFPGGPDKVEWPLHDFLVAIIEAAEALGGDNWHVAFNQDRGFDGDDSIYFQVFRDATEEEIAAWEQQKLARIHDNEIARATAEYAQYEALKAKFEG